MTRTFISTVAALSLSLASGVAFAQQTSSTDAGSDNPNRDDANIFMDSEIMSGFYMDDEYTELRSEEEIRTAYDAMAAEDQELLVTECSNLGEPTEDPNQEAAATASHEALCDQIATF